MTVELEHRETTGTLDEIILSPADRYVQLGEVLKFTRNHPPPRNCQPRTTPEDETLDACVYLREEGVQPYRFTGPLEWASYAEIRECFTRAAGNGRRTHIAPYVEPLVFAPLKLVLADRDDGFRAVLTPLPVYPRRGVIGTLVPWQDFRLIYAAAAYLNSKLALGLYRRALWGIAGTRKKGDGIDKRVLASLPIACRGYRRAHLEQVAALSNQLHVLFEAELECGLSFARQIRETEDRLLPALVNLLGWPEYGLESLFRETLPEEAQLSLDLDELRMPSRPPIRLVEPGLQLHRSDLKRLRFWEGAVNAALPDGFLAGVWT
jgi:hypothetical protein